MPYRYLGHNTFESPGMPEGLSDTLAFELLPDGKIKCTHEFVFENNAKGKDTFWKEKK